MPIKLLLAKPGLDVHDRGVRMIARACREAGMEVVYLGTGIQTVPQCVESAVQEDADVLGLSIMTGQPKRMCQEALDELKKRGAEDIPLVVGGVIRADQKEELLKMGVRAAFSAGASLTDVIAAIEQAASGAKGASKSA